MLILFVFFSVTPHAKGNSIKKQIDSSIASATSWRGLQQLASLADLLAKEADVAFSKIQPSFKSRYQHLFCRLRKFTSLKNQKKKTLCSPDCEKQKGFSFYNLFGPQWSLLNEDSHRFYWIKDKIPRLSPTGNTYGALWCHNSSSEWVRVDHKVYKFALISFLVSPRGPTK